MPKVKTVKEYIYVVVDEDGDGDSTFDKKEDAVDYCNNYVGWKVYRYWRNLNKKRKDGAVHVSPRTS